MNKSKIIEISNIKDIQSIKIDRLMDTEDILDPILIVLFYDNGRKSLVYTESENEFLYFFSTIRRVYNEEKNKRNIYIDKLSKEFLESKEPNIELAKLKNKIGQYGTTKKINYKKQEIEIYYNLLKHILEDLFKYLNRHIEIKGIKGFGKHQKLIFEEEGLEKYLSFNINGENGEYHLTFPGIIKNKELYIDINYNEKIQIKIYDYEEKIIISYEIITTKDYGKIIKTIITNGTLSSKIINELEQTKPEEIYDYELSEGVTYKLPWGVRTINTTTRTNELKSETTKYTDYFNYNNHTQIREKTVEYLTKKGFGKRLTDGFYKIKGDLKIQVDNRIIITNYYKLDNYLIKETTFLSHHLTRGIYKSCLEGKTFYKAYILTEENTYMPLQTEIQENIKGYELINERELKLLIKRSEK